MSDTANLMDIAADLARKQALVADAMKATKALRWLREYGPNLPGKDNFTVRFGLHFAGSCSGSEEATEFLKAAAEELILRIVEDAVTRAEGTIAKATGAA